MSKILAASLLLLCCFFDTSSATFEEAHIEKDEAGNSVALWSEFDGSHTHIYSCIRPKGDSWTSPETISSIKGDIQPKIHLSVAADGAAVAVWEELDDGHPIIKAAILPLEESWSEPYDLSEPGALAFDPTVTFYQDNAFAVWSQMVGKEVIQQCAFIKLGEMKASAAPPTVTNVNPNFGPTTGGNTVTIFGTNFTGATAVKFGATSASFTVLSSTQIIATAPLHTTGTFDVTVTTPGGTSATSPADQYTYFILPPPIPVVTNVNPNVGPTGGGTTVTITGFNFTGATSVKFGATNATSFTVNSSTSITAISPAGTGTVDVTVTVPIFGTSQATPADHFTYVPAPTVTKVNPNTGPTTGGNSVTITGTNFTGATAVHFGSTPATSFIVNSSTSITAIAPPGSGRVHVTVTTPGGTSATSAADLYQYKTVPPLHFIGILKENKFLNHTEFILKATWSPSPTTTVTSYRIFEGKKLVKEIPATAPLVFKACFPDRSVPRISITAVSPGNLESKHIYLRIKE